MDNRTLDNLQKAAMDRKSKSVSERMNALTDEQRDYLFHLAVMNEYLSIEDIQTYLEICGFTSNRHQLNDFIELCLSQNVVTPYMLEGSYVPQFMVETDTKNHFGQTISAEEIRQLHIYADQYYRNIFVSMLNEIYKLEGVELPKIETEDELANSLIQPGGLIDFGAHIPQAQYFHNWSLSRAYYWQEHLFFLGKYEEAAHITNSICFALARKGQKRIAKEMLARNIAVTNGLHKAVSLVNLATVLREDMEHDTAMRIYTRALYPLMECRAYPQLAGVFSEMSNIHRDKGHLASAIILQHISLTMRALMKDLKGKAICRNQLSILYRSLRFYGLALKFSRAAESYWRVVEDEVNLAKTLLTQGNLYNHMQRFENAINCFEESYEINCRIENYKEVANTLNGKATALMHLKKYHQAREYLDEAIALRQRYSNRMIGIEYYNMGYLYELQDDNHQALSWYKKALNQLEKYQPGMVPLCNRNIRKIERRVRR